VSTDPDVDADKMGQSHGEYRIARLRYAGVAQVRHALFRWERGTRHSRKTFWSFRCLARIMRGEW